MGGYMQEGNMIFITAQVRPHQFIKGKTELVIGDVKFLNDIVKDSIQRLTITVPEHSITDDMVAGLIEMADKKDGSAELIIRIQDGDGEIISLSSPSMKVNVKKEFIEFLEDNAKNNLSFTLI